MRLATCGGRGRVCWPGPRALAGPRALVGPRVLAGATCVGTPRRLADLQRQLAPADGFRDSLSARRRVQLIKHGREVKLHGVGRDGQRAGNALV